MVKETVVTFLSKPKLNNPVFIEGLPGIGYIGRNAAGYLVDEVGAVKFAELLSPHLPPVVLMDPKKNGMIVGLKNDFYYYKAKSKTERDLIILIGDSQSMDPKGHYVIVSAILDTLEMFNVKEMVTIGGFGTGELSEGTSKVFGAAILPEKIEAFEKLNVQFKDTNIGQIIGASGLLISLGHRRGIEGVCLMGETSGLLLSDPKSTEAVLEVLAKYLNIKLDMTQIEKRVKEIEKMIEKIENLQTKLATHTKDHDDSLGYIG
ncbi:MAG: proteasome assembly chaperone family protein [archaeon]